MVWDFAETNPLEASSEDGRAHWNGSLQRFGRYLE